MMPSRSGRPPLLAVLTGDVVASTALGAKDAAKLASRIEEAWGLAAEASDAAVTKVDVFRGDAWQAAVHEVRDVFSVALRMRIALRWLVAAPRVDTRIAIGVGSFDVIDAQRLSRSRGAAFELSGRALDAIGRGRRLTVRVEDDAILEATLDTILDLVDTLVQTWSEAQAYAVDHALLGWTQEETAANWSPKAIRQQAVHKHLKRAGWPAIGRALDHTRHLLNHWSEAGVPSRVEGRVHP